jgi:prepilin-type N-terminal cleavage/methylation domain-containing protein
MKQRGISLIEVLIAMAILAFCVLALSLSTMMNTQASNQLKAKDIRMAKATSMMDRLKALPFGSPVDGPPLPEQLDEVFSGHIIIPEFPEDTLPQLTLTQIREVSPVWFKLEGVETTGRWTVYVDNDLDGNGIIDEEFLREGRDDLFRIVIQYEGKPVVSTIITAFPQDVTRD